MNSNLKILVTGNNYQIAMDVSEHLKSDRGYMTVRCSPDREYLFEKMVTELPNVVIICLRNEHSGGVRVYDILDSAVREGLCTVIVITNDEDERMFRKYSSLPKVFFLSRPVSLFALYEKLYELEEEVAKRKEQNLSPFREFINPNAASYSDRKNVLVVDDDTEQLINIKEQLKEFYKVTAVKSGEDALRYIEKRRPDIILLDYIMPELDGPAVLRQLRMIEEYADIPVIFLTGVTDREKVINTLAELKPQGYMVKPSKKSEIVANIIEVLG